MSEFFLDAPKSRDILPAKENVMLKTRKRKRQPRSRSRRKSINLEDQDLIRQVVLAAERRGLGDASLAAIARMALRAWVAQSPAEVKPYPTLAPPSGSTTVNPDGTPQSPATPAPADA